MFADIHIDEKKRGKKESQSHAENLMLTFLFLFHLITNGWEQGWAKLINKCQVQVQVQLQVSHPVIVFLFFLDAQRHLCLCL